MFDFFPTQDERTTGRPQRRTHEHALFHRSISYTYGLKKRKVRKEKKNLATSCIPTWLGVFLQQRLQLLFLLAVKLALHGQQHVLVQQHPYQVKRACSNQTAFRRTCLRMQRKGSRGTGYLHNPEGCCCLLFVGCLTSQRHASVSQGRICSDNFFVLPHWDRSCISNFPSHPVTVYWHRADQSQRWPYNARRLAG